MTQPGEPTGVPDPQEGLGDGQPQQPGPPPYGAQQPPAPSYGQPPQAGQPPYPQQYGPPPTAAAMDPSQERLYAGAAHWGALVAGFVSSGFLAWLVPLLVMMLKGPASPFVRRQAVESLNFQINMIIWAVVSGILILALIGFLLLPLVGIWWLVFTIIGAVKASNGEDYRYPLIIRFVS